MWISIGGGTRFGLFSTFRSFWTKETQKTHCFGHLIIQHSLIETQKYDTQVCPEGDRHHKTVTKFQKKYQ